MRKLALFVVALLAANMTFAQKGIEIGLEFTPASPWILNDEDFGEGDNLDFRGTFGYNAGISLGFNITDGLGIASGIMLSRQGQNYRTAYDSRQSADQDQFARQLTYVRVPILLKFNGDPSESSGSYFRVGPHIDFISAARYTYDDNSILNIDRDIDMLDYAPLGTQLDIYQQTVIGATLEFGGSANINEYMKIVFMLHLSGSFTATEGEDAGFVYPSSGLPNFNRSQAWNVMGGINIGYHYIFSFD